MKLVLGTAALGMNYGLFSYKKINREEFKKIEKLVLESKIKLIDTASSYGTSEKIIGNSKLKKLNIITKIKLPKYNNIHSLCSLNNLDLNDVKLDSLDCIYRKGLFY